MGYLDNYGSFNESNLEKKSVRSERILNQTQKEWDSEQESGINQDVNISPVMLFTDIVGSSKLWSDDPYNMSKQLISHHDLVNDLSEKYNGWVVKTIGDAFMVYFEPNENSLLNSLKFSKDLIKQEKKYNLRIGICSGNMESRTYRLQKVDLKDFYGNVVNTSSRMESKVAQSGGVAFTSVKKISNNTLNQIKKEIGLVLKANLTSIDLNGVKVDDVYKINFK